LFDGFHTKINTKELAGTCQIQREQELRPLVVRSHQLPRKVAQIQSSQDQHKQQQKPPVSTQAIPDQTKHKLIQDKLTKQFMRQSNIVSLRVMTFVSPVIVLRLNSSIAILSISGGWIERYESRHVIDVLHRTVAGRLSV
jgi:hypothetical protein